MFTVSVIYIFWMFGDIHVNTVGDTRGHGAGAAHVNPVDMKLSLGLRIRHPRLPRHLVDLVQHQEVGGGGHGGGGGGRDGDGPGGGRPRPVPELGLAGGGGRALTLAALETIFGLFIAECRHARVLGAQR